MTRSAAPTIAAASDYERLADRFRPVFRRIGAASLERERAGVHSHEQLGWLVDAGFARVRIPRRLGGEGVPLSWVFRLISELAEEDPNLAHIWRNHFSFLEDRLHALDDPRSEGWIARLGRGEIVGGGWSEPGPATTGSVDTTIVRGDDGRWRVNGVKYYSTGSVFADWITVLALDPDGAKVVALVPTAQPGVVIGDDWDGFGQRLTGSGSVTYTDALVAEDGVIPYATRYRYQEQFYQSTLHALLVGIGRAIVRDGSTALRARARTHWNATTSDPGDDPELLQVIGRLSANAFGAESAFRRSIEEVDAAVAATEAVPTDAESSRSAARLDAESWVAVAQAQQVISDLVLESATIVFDALGSSGTSGSIALDRHWRNARTITSHNPRLYKTRLVGDWVVNGRDPAARTAPASEVPAEDPGTGVAR